MPYNLDQQKTDSRFHRNVYAGEHVMEPATLTTSTTYIVKPDKPKKKRAAKARRKAGRK